MVQHETQDSWHAWILGISRCTSLFETCVFLSLVHCGRVHAKNDEDLFIAIWCRTNSGRLRQCGQLGSVYLVRVAIIGSQGWIPSRATSGCGDDFFLHHCVSDFHCDMASLLIYLLQVDWKFHDKDSNISCWPVHQYFDSHQKHCFRFSMISIFSGFVPQQHLSNLLILQVFAMARRLSSLACNDLLHVKSWNLPKSRTSPENLEIDSRFWASQVGGLGGLTTWMPCAAGIRWDVTTGGKKEPEDATLNKYSSEARVFWTQGVKPRWLRKTTGQMSFFWWGNLVITGNRGCHQNDIMPLLEGHLTWMIFFCAV